MRGQRSRRNGFQQSCNEFSLPCSSDPFRDDSFSTRRPDNTDRIIRPICLVEAKGKLGLEGKDRSHRGLKLSKKKKKFSSQRWSITFSWLTVNARLSAIHKIHGYGARMAATGSGGRGVESSRRGNGNGIAPRQCQAAIFHAIPLLCD